MKYHIATDDEYNRTHKRERISIWSGWFCSDYEGEGYSLPNRNGYSIALYGGRKLKVLCPCPRTEENYLEVDAIINAALAKETQS